MKKTLTILASVLTIGTSGLLHAGEAAEVTLTAEKIGLAFDLKEITVKPGQKVKLKLVNPTGSPLPHNVLIVKPGTLQAVGMAAIQAAADPEFLTTKQAVPTSEDVLFASQLVPPGEETVLEFTAPAEAGDYPYVCTYPGHSFSMHGLLKVAE